MLQTSRSFRGMVCSPHHLASRAGQRVLEEGGNAIEAMVAAASTIAVVYPHMNGLGGDNFWLFREPGNRVFGIDSCGGAALKADINFYSERGYKQIPTRGPLSAITCAGAVAGWNEALKVSQKDWGGKMCLSRLLEDAIFYAEDGVAVTKTQSHNGIQKFSELKNVPGFCDTFTINGKLPEEGQKFRQERLAKTLRKLCENGLDDFYRGELGRTIAADLHHAGSPLGYEDLERFKSLRVTPISLIVEGHKIYNMPPPTQGLASLLLLGINNRLNTTEAETFEFIHNLVESTKLAFKVRDTYVSDPDYMSVNPNTFLQSEKLDKTASMIQKNYAMPWPDLVDRGDTVWLGAIDNKGRSVSFIQSIYWEFGSGVVLGETGITWQNRGTSFSLNGMHHNSLKPGRRPFHTIQPALALLSDGRVMVYGTMGGEGQPQTQAAIFNRYVVHGQGLQEAITGPRWLLGRTWGSETSNLRIEHGFEPLIYESLRKVGHDLEVVGRFDEIMGHAGAIVCHLSGLKEGASDPRSDGVVAAF